MATWVCHGEVSYPADVFIEAETEAEAEAKLKEMQDNDSVEVANVDDKFPLFRCDDIYKQE